MKIEKLWDRHVGQTIYIVGTGPSMQVFPLDFLKDKITIGLNQAYLYFNPTYSLTIHPDLIPTNIDAQYNTRWIIKKKLTGQSWTNNIRISSKYFYVFENNRRIDDFRFCKHRVCNKLYVGHGIQTGALTLTGHMGASYAVLVGCDMCAMVDQYHGHDQHVRWEGVPPEKVFREYYESTIKVRNIIRSRFKTQTISLTPFVSLNNYQEDFVLLKKELNKPQLPKPTNISLLAHQLKLNFSEEIEI